MHVARDQLEQTLLVKTGHVRGNIHTPLVHQVTTVVMKFFKQLVFFRNRLEFNHCHVTAFFKRAGLVHDISNAARHASGKIASCTTQNHYNAACHIFTSMVTNTFDNSNGARVSNSKTLTCNTVEITFTGNRSVKNSIANDDRVFSFQWRILSRANNDTPA